MHVCVCVCVCVEGIEDLGFYGFSCLTCYKESVDGMNCMVT